MKSILTLIVFVPLVLVGQSFKGRVVDDLSQALIGAHVFNVSSNRHTHTDENGNFRLDQVQLNDSLRVTYVGYKTRFVIIDSMDDVLIVLDADPTPLDEIVISPGIDVINEIVKVDLQANPVNSSQEILTYVPGLFIGQHAGGGKAEQIFLRGFDIDHGTDLAITVDGMPVNMVSHAHGQGYADLHFLIPETIDRIEFGKGPYYASQGNFNTAGYVNFKTKRVLESNQVKVEVGDFNSTRVLGMFKLPSTEKANGYIASELIETDGPFESPQGFNRLNLFGNYTFYATDNHKVRLLASHFSSQWDASGQIPVRAVEDRSITRFGAIDDTEGGKTSRQNIAVEFGSRIDEKTLINSLIYYNSYQFELYSNFTFFLVDPVNGDQIRQKERRNIYGFKSELDRTFQIGGADGDLQAGLEVRNDFVFDNELSFSRNRRETLRSISFGNIVESNKSVYLSTNLDIGKWGFNVGVRGDLIDFSYTDMLAPSYMRSGFKITTLNPKLSVQYNHTNDIQFYIKAGRGFHSNDARTVTEKVDPIRTIPRAYGLDIGNNWKPLQNVFVNTGLWYLHLDQEFVYVGDAGIVEPSGESRRQGVDVTIRYQPYVWALLNFDLTVTDAEILSAPIEEKSIPLAPKFTFTSGLNLTSKNGWYGGVSLRHMGDRPAKEDNSIIAEGYTIVDSNMGYQWQGFKVDFQVQNLLGAEWNETQFATESRLSYEDEPVEEIHFTPGTPFFIKGSITYSF